MSPELSTFEPQYLLGAIKSQHMSKDTSQFLERIQCLQNMGKTLHWEQIVRPRLSLAEQLSRILFAGPLFY